MSLVFFAKIFVFLRLWLALLLRELCLVVVCIGLTTGRRVQDTLLVTLVGEEEAERLSGLLDWERALVRIAGAARYLTRHRRCDGRVGIVGFGLGGGLAFAAASRMPELGAVVAFYGLPVKGTFDPERVTAPVLAHFAARDPWARPERGKQIQDAIRRSHGQMSLCVYEADHAFVNDSRGEVYAANLATLAWDRTMVFLQDQLGTGA